MPVLEQILSAQKEVTSARAVVLNSRETLLQKARELLAINLPSGENITVPGLAQDSENILVAIENNGKISSYTLDIFNPKNPIVLQPFKNAAVPSEAVRSYFGDKLGLFPKKSYGRSAAVTFLQIDADDEEISQESSKSSFSTNLNFVDGRLRKKLGEPTLSPLHEKLFSNKNSEEKNPQTQEEEVVFPLGFISGKGLLVRNKKGDVAYIGRGLNESYQIDRTSHFRQIPQDIVDWMIKKTGYVRKVMRKTEVAVTLVPASEIEIKIEAQDYCGLENKVNGLKLESHLDNEAYRDIFKGNENIVNVLGYNKKTDQLLVQDVNTKGTYWFVHGVEAALLLATDCKQKVSKKLIALIENAYGVSSMRAKGKSDSHYFGSLEDVVELKTGKKKIEPTQPELLSFGSFLGKHPKAKINQSPSSPTKLTGTYSYGTRNAVEFVVKYSPRARTIEIVAEKPLDTFYTEITANSKAFAHVQGDNKWQLVGPIPAYSLFSKLGDAAAQTPENELKDRIQRMPGIAATKYNATIQQMQCTGKSAAMKFEFAISLTPYGYELKPKNGDELPADLLGRIGKGLNDVAVHPTITDTLIWVKRQMIEKYRREVYDKQHHGNALVEKIRASRHI